MRSRRIVATAAGVLALFVGGAFAYGYWHTVSHGVFYPDVRDSSGRDVRHSDANLTFLDDSGRELAQAETDDDRVFYLSGPYSCRELEKRAPFDVGGHEAYAQCFARQSRWVIEWIRDVSYVDVRIGACRWRMVPVIVSQHPSGPADWWPWWPIPHMGGSPYSSFHTSVTVDARGCASLTNQSRSGVKDPAHVRQAPGRGARGATNIGEDLNARAGRAATTMVVEAQAHAHQPLWRPRPRDWFAPGSDG